MSVQHPVVAAELPERQHGVEPVPAPGGVAAQHPGQPRRPQQRRQPAAQQVAQQRAASGRRPQRVAAAGLQIERADLGVLDAVLAGAPRLHGHPVAARQQAAQVVEHEGLRDRRKLGDRQRDAHQCWSFAGGARSTDSAKW